MSLERESNSQILVGRLNRMVDYLNQSAIDKIGPFDLKLKESGALEVFFQLVRGLRKEGIEGKTSLFSIVVYHDCHGEGKKEFVFGLDRQRNEPAFLGGWDYYNEDQKLLELLLGDWETLRSINPLDAENFRVAAFGSTLIWSNYCFREWPFSYLNFTKSFAYRLIKTSGLCLSFSNPEDDSFVLNGEVSFLIDLGAGLKIQANPPHKGFRYEFSEEEGSNKKKVQKIISTLFSEMQRWEV